MRESRSIKNIRKACRAIKRLTDKDLQEFLDISNHQQDYMNPYNIQLTERINWVGNHNKLVIDAICTLKSTLKSRDDDYKEATHDQA